MTSAGIDEFANFTEITPKRGDRMIAVNLTGTFHCLQSAVPDMLAGRWGRIVTISSSSAQSGAARMAHYVASKGGVIGLTKSLALELAPHGHHREYGPARVHRHSRCSAGPRRAAISPTSTRWSPVRRYAGPAPPEDIAAAVAFLCSDDAGYITGQAINVNGGWYL